MTDFDENPMVHGKGVYDSGQFDPQPIRKPYRYECPRCGCEVPLKDRVYEWEQENWICEDCIEDAIGSLSLYDKAEMAGEEECYTHQMLEGASSTAEKAEILYIESTTAEEIA